MNTKFFTSIVFSILVYNNNAIAECTGKEYTLNRPAFPTHFLQYRFGSSLQEANQVCKRYSNMWLFRPDQNNFDFTTYLCAKSTINAGETNGVMLDFCKNNKLCGITFMSSQGDSSNYRFKNNSDNMINAFLSVYGDITCSSSSQESIELQWRWNINSNGSYPLRNYISLHLVNGEKYLPPSQSDRLLYVGFYNFDYIKQHDLFLEKQY